MHQSIGKIIILVGAVLVLTGIIWYFFGDKFKWLGRLPGDIRIEGENTRIYIPIVTTLLLSLVLTLIVKLVQWFLNR